MPDAAGLPDFLIVGAMKAGTTSLHAMLDEHPDVHVPPGELFYFSMDDFVEHPPFFIDRHGRWREVDLEAGTDEKLTWYAERFAAARPGQVIGEDSTTYLSSHRAPGRIRQLLPDARIVISLRDPASRAYSAYWQGVTRGRFHLSFEDTLDLSPGALLDRSRYVPQVRRYLDAFPRDQVRIILFEDLVREPARVVGDLLEFLGVSAGAWSPSRTHDNRGLIPRWPALARARNRLLWRRMRPNWGAHLPGIDREPFSEVGVGWRILDRLHRRINPSRPVPPPAMAPATRSILDHYLEIENRPLEGILGRDLRAEWYPSLRPA